MKFFLILLLCPLSYALSQDHPVKNYSVRDGLPSSEVYDIFQDSKGYIWLATDAGASRFDGNSFQNHTTLNGLTDNTVFGFYEDAKKRLWIRTMNGGVSYFLNDTIHTLPVNEEIIRSLDRWAFITSLMVDDNEILWLGYNKNKYATIDLKRTGSMNIKDTKECTYIINGNNNSSIWGGILNHECQELAQINRNRRSSIRFTDSTGSQKTTRFNFGAHTSGNSVFIFRGNIVYHIKDNKIISSRTFKENISFIKEDNEGNLWIGRRDNGVSAQKGFDLFNEEHHYFPNISINDVLHDKENSLWFSTQSEGVYFISNRKIQTYLHTIKDNRIDVVVPYKGNSVLAGMNGGHIAIIDLKTGDYELLPETSAGRIRSLVVQGDDIWIGGTSAITCYNTKRRSYTTYTHHNTRSICKESDSTFLLGKNGGLSRYNFKEKKLQHTTLAPELFSTLHVIQARKDEFFIATHDGLRKFSKGLITDYSSIPALKNRIEYLNNFNGKLWLATRANGVIVFDPGSNTIDTLDETDGLSSNLCRAIHNDKNGIIWVGTNKGLHRIEQKDGKYIIKSINTFDGLISNEVNSICSLNGNIIAGTTEGISVFSGEEIVNNPCPPPIYLTTIKINGKDTAISQHYSLSHSQNFIQISFHALTYKSPENTLYKFRMSGIDNDWVFSKTPDVQYTTMPPGNYTFIVYAMNNSGVWSTSPSIVIFSIAKPVWQRWWFITLALGFAAAICIMVISVFYRRSLRLQAERNEYERRIIEGELRSLRSQINPHFIFNSLNSIQRFILENDPLAANNYLSKFSRLIRNVLINSRSDIITLSEEVNTLRIYLELENLRCNNKFSFDIQIDPDLDPSKIKLPGMMIQPFVENSIWHGLMPRGGEGNITIRFQNHREEILCEIKDNGVGRNYANRSSSLHKSLGITVTQERVKTLNYRYKRPVGFEIIDLKENGEASGTLVLLTLPNLSAEHRYQPELLK